MNLIKTIKWVVVFLMLFVSSISFSQEKKKKKTSINFEDELIEGEVKKPELFYLLQQKQFNFKRLIKLRENFLPEMRRSAEEIPRSGRVN